MHHQRQRLRIIAWMIARCIARDDETPSPEPTATPTNTRSIQIKIIESARRKNELFAAEDLTSVLERSLLSLCSYYLPVDACTSYCGSCDSGLQLSVPSRKHACIHEIQTKISQSRSNALVRGGERPSASKQARPHCYLLSTKRVKPNFMKV